MDRRNKAAFSNFSCVLWTLPDMPRLSCAFLTFMVNSRTNRYIRRPVSSFGRASDNRAGGLGFEPQTGPTLNMLPLQRHLLG